MQASHFSLTKSKFGYCFHVHFIHHELGVAVPGHTGSFQGERYWQKIDRIPLTSFESVSRAHAPPLSQVPNAGWGAAYSRLMWAFYQEFRGKITIELPKLHERLGEFTPSETIGAGMLQISDKNDYRPIGTNRTQ